MVEFYAPWCEHCQTLAPEWDKAAEILSSNNEIKFAKVDATVEEELAEHFQIDTFPTIFFLKKGRAIPYDGGSETGEEIVLWVEEHMAPAVTMITTLTELEDIEKDSEVLVIGIFESLDPSSAGHSTSQQYLEDFIHLAEYHDTVRYLLTSSLELQEALEVLPGTLVILKKFDDQRADLSLTDLKHWDQAIKFVVGNSSPLVQIFSDENAPKIFSSPIRLHGLFLTDVTNAEIETYESVMREVAKIHQGEVLTVMVPHTFTDLMEFFSVQSKDLPKFILMDVRDKESEKFPLDTLEFTTEIISNHIFSILSGVGRDEDDDAEDEEGESEKGGEDHSEF
jgi:protein disulfide-isomerase A1